MGQPKRAVKTRAQPKPEKPKLRLVPQKKATDELWRRGKLRYLLRPEQQLLLADLHAAPKGVNVWNISRRWGKTTVCGVFCVEWALRKPGSNIRFGTAFRTDLEEIIGPIFDWILHDCPPRLRPKYKESRKVFEFPNGSRIKLVGLDKNPNGLRGNAIDLMIIDEGAFVKNLKKIYISVIVPATMKRKFKLIFPSTPPESPSHFWAAGLIPKAQKAGTYKHLTIDDISDLDDEEKERLFEEVGGKWTTAARREFYGEIIVDDEKALAPSFKILHHVEAYEPKEGMIKWTMFGDGGGVRDKTVFLKMGFCHFRKMIIVRQELAYPKLTGTDDIIRGYKERKFNEMSLYGDFAGQLQIDYGKAGLSIAPVIKDDFNAGLQALNTAFLNDRILIHPECSLLIQTLLTGLLNNQRTDYERTPELGHCDAAACLIYGIRGVDRTNYWPAGWNLPKHSHHVPDMAPATFASKLDRMLMAQLGG